MRGSESGGGGSRANPVGRRHLLQDEGHRRRQGSRREAPVASPVTRRHQARHRREGQAGRGGISMDPRRRAPPTYTFPAPMPAGTIMPQDDVHPGRARVRRRGRRRRRVHRARGPVSASGQRT